MSVSLYIFPVIRCTDVENDKKKIFNDAKIQKTCLRIYGKFRILTSGSVNSVIIYGKFRNLTSGSEMSSVASPGRLRVGVAGDLPANKVEVERDHRRVKRQLETIRQLDN